MRNVIAEIGPRLRGIDALDQREIDATLIDLDGTPNKGRLGANAILGVSLAVAHAAADELGIELYRYVGGVRAHVLPVPMMNVVNGGAHADNSLDLQEFMLMPLGAATFAEALRMGAEIFHALHGRLHEQGLATAVGDEGGFAPDIASTEEAIKAICEAVERAGYAPGDQVGDRARPGHDASSTATAATPAGRGPRAGRGRDRRLVGRPRRALPDRVDRGRHGRGRLGRLEAADRQARRRRAARRRRPVRDELRAPERGRRRGVANAILIKVNQIGTLTETLDTIELGLRHGYASIMSHRSGETEDTTIADLAVATNAGQIKTGAPSRSDRVAKYNQLLRIDDELGERAVYLGRAAFAAQQRSLATGS